MASRLRTGTLRHRKLSQWNWPSVIFAIWIGHLSTPAQAEPAETAAKTAITHSRTFQRWLSEHESKFANCLPKQTKASIHLCDGTEISIPEIQKLFDFSSDQLVAYLKSQKLRVEILCSQKEPGEFHSNCKDETSKKTFQAFGFLHGQFDATTSTIFLRSDSSRGSLIHEYLHFKQTKNRIRVFGKIYKKERFEVEQALNRAFDLLLKEVQKAEQGGDIRLVSALIPIAQELTQEIASYAKWQILIDERNLFLAYQQFQSSLHVPAPDVALAKKNMAFICEDPRTRTTLRDSPECKADEKRSSK